LGLERQRPRRTNLHAVAAEDARGLRQLCCVFRGYLGVEPAARDLDREGVLPLDPAGIHALVAEDALAVVAHIQVVVDLVRLAHRGRDAAVTGVVLARLVDIARQALAGAFAVTIRVDAVTRLPLGNPGRGRQIDRGVEQLQDEPTTVPDPVGVGHDLHAGLNL